MNLEIKVFSALCHLEIFTVNGITADEDDFVEKHDRSFDEAEEHACGDMQANVIKSTKEVLKKYQITEDEYQNIGEEVADLLSFGFCGWCV